MAVSVRSRKGVLVGLTALLSVTTVALFTYFFSKTLWSSDVITQTVVLTAIAWVAEAQSVQFSKRIQISSANLPVLLGIFFLGPAPSALIASISILVINSGKDFLRVVVMFTTNAVSVMLLAVLVDFLEHQVGYSVPVSQLSLGFFLVGLLVGFSS